MPMSPRRKAETKGTSSSLPVALAGMVAGPVTVVLHEVGWLSLGPTATLWSTASIVFVSMLGILVGARIWVAGSRWLGAVVALPNLLVLGPYLFFLLFFGMGGSR